MENALESHNASSNIAINIDVKYIPSPSTSLPPLTIQFHLHTHEQYRYIPPYDPTQYQPPDDYNQTNTKSLRLTLDPSEYMSHDMFSLVMQWNLENMDEEYFDNNRRDRVIQDMIRKIRVIVNNRSKKGLKEFEIVVGVILNIDHAVSHGGGILLGEGSSRFHGMVPASESAMEFLKKKEVDEESMNDDCVICLEKLGKEEELLRMPCSHVFHGDCIIHWLENGHCCPICRYEMPKNH